MNIIRRTLSNSAGRRVALAMSGGVDSSVAAHLLSQEFDNVLGIHMSNWDYHGDDDSSQDSKCWEQDWKDAKEVAQHLQIPIVHTSFEREYWNEVFEPYCQQLAQNITPNPDVDCNRYIKFGVLKDYIRQKHQIDALATGHYARVWDPNVDPMPPYLEEAVELDPTMAELLDKDQPTLLAARDASKDQSYFLSGVQGKALKNVLFPLGDLYKQQPREGQNRESMLSVREIAQQAQLPTAQKRDSMGICFVGKRKHGSFVNEYIDQPIVAQGQCINVEDGTIMSMFDPQKSPSLVYATIGQGAKISGASQKWFVVDRPDPTTLVVCPGTHHSALYADTLILEQLNWIAGHPPKMPLRAQCRIRHLQPLVDCQIQEHKAGGYEILLEQPLRGIAPGQICGIYYNSLVCLGGGAITRRGASYWELQKDLPQHLHPSGRNDLSSIHTSIQ